MGRIIQSASTFKKSPTVYLTEKEGLKITGRVQKRVESKVWPGKLSYLIEVEDTDASIRLYDAATKTESEVDIVAGEPVFLKGSTLLDGLMREVKDGERITVTYTGKGVAKPGRKAPYKYQVEIH